MDRLNIGCGMDYREGWVNLDMNREVKVDVYADMSKSLPFRNDSIAEVVMDNVLEHVPRERFFAFLDELHRVCRPGARIDIYVPHYSGMHAFKHPGHCMYFGVGSFHLYEPRALFNGERYTKARFQVFQERLLFFHHNLVNYPMLSKLPINWLFNWSMAWRLLMERFQFFGFDEIRYELRVVK